MNDLLSAVGTAGSLRLFLSPCLFYLVWILSLSLLTIECFSQTTLQINGGHLIQNGNSQIVLQNTEWTNNGIYESGTGTVLFSGDHPQEQTNIGGNSISQFYNLELQKSANGVQLEQNIEIKNELRMNGGILDLHGDTILLATPNSAIINESEFNRILGPNGGIIQKMVDPSSNAPNAYGNLGVELITFSFLGQTLIQRAHVPESINGGSSIARSFRILPSVAGAYDATLLFEYFEAELEGNAESDLGAWQQDPSFWHNTSFSILDPMNNVMQVEQIDNFGKWTLAPRAPQVDLRVLLAGPYNPGNLEMNDELRVANSIPTTEPYAALGYIHPSSGGGESINPAVLETSGSDAIVDWVFVELRDTNDLSIVLAARSALLQRDGDIVDLDGQSVLSFPEISLAEMPMISIRHRNHVGIIASSLIDFSNGPASLDFSTNPALIQGGTAAMMDFGNGQFGLISGDFDGDGQVQNTDLNALVLTLGSSGYLKGDTDLNGQVQNTDLQIKLTPNLGRGAQFTY